MFCLNSSSEPSRIDTRTTSSYFPFGIVSISIGNVESKNDTYYRINERICRAYRISSGSLRHAKFPQEAK